MPYVKEEFRGLLDSAVEEVRAALDAIRESHGEDNLDGCLNYVITRTVDGLYGMGGYAVFNRAMGVLDCVAREFYRRKVAPYEDKKIAENGDVYR